MARVSLDLSQFKSSGVYTVEIDNSERIVVTTQSLRLLVGYSPVGPFNAPVFIRTVKDRQRFYGDIDRKSERKGSFFHRSIDTALLSSAVFAIALLKVDQTPDSPDVVEYTALSLDSSAANIPSFDGSIYNSLFSNFFNKQRFWTPDADYLQGVVQNGYGISSANAAPLFQLANVGTKQISFIIRKATNVQGFSVFAKDYYGTEANIPYSWIRPYDKLSDFFVQIIAVEGDWNNYSSLSTDPIFSTYFTSQGLKSDKINDFLNLPQISLVSSYIGTIIPDFIDGNGANQYIETIVNNATNLTGILLNINKDALDDLIWDTTSNQWELGDGSSTSAAPYLIDLVGHNLIDYSSTNLTKSFLSYSIDVSIADFHTTIAYSAATVDGSILSLSSWNGKSFATSINDASALTIGSLVKSGAEIQPGVTYITEKTWVADNSCYIFETAEPISGYTSALSGNLTVQKPLTDITVTPTLKFLVLNGLNINNNLTPGYSTTGSPNAEEGVTKIYSMLTEDPGVYRGLTNPEMIQYRYIVDTMSYGLRPYMGGKSYLSKLAKARGKCTAILNAPSIAHFAASTDPYFSDAFIPGVDPKPEFNSAWIAQGGNPDMARSFRFSLPSEDLGAKYCGVFGPFLKYADNGKTLLVPPAADVSNTFVRKFLGGDPYAIVANKNGIISNPNLLGVEYMIDKQDRDYLEPFGYNSIIERLSTGEILIYSNATAYQTLKSDYNYLHVRELLNTIEIQVEEVLKNFVFLYNNPVTRLQIVNSVSPLLQNIQDAGALFKYEVVMDDSNNTADLVDEGFAILDIGVWINKGMQKLINRVTVNSLSGTASSGGFTNA